MTELTVSDNPVNNAISDGMYSSFPVQTFDDRKKLFQVISNASRLGDNIGKVIQVKHLVIQPVELVDRVTNEPIDGHRIILIDDKVILMLPRLRALLMRFVISFSLWVIRLLGISLFR